MSIVLRIASAAALAATATMAASPVVAADLPRADVPIGVASPGVFDADAVNADQYRYYRRNRVDAGDVIGAVVVLGTIAAVASAVSNASRSTRGSDYRYPQGYPAPYPNGGYDQRDYRANNGDSRMDDSRGIDRAVDMCVAEVERNGRVDSVDEAVRSGDGWRVSGRTDTGSAFNCSIGNDGRIGTVDYGQGVGRRGAVNDGQWSDERYAAARQAQDAITLPGTDPADDGRYDTAQSPDVPG